MLTTSRIEMEVLPDRACFMWWQNHLSNGAILEDGKDIILKEVDNNLHLSVFNYSNGEFLSQGLYRYELILWHDGDNWQEFVKRGTQVMLCSS